MDEKKINNLRKLFSDSEKYYKAMLKENGFIQPTWGQINPFSYPLKPKEELSNIKIDDVLWLMGDNNET